jgi:hypothetical protein
MLRLAAAITIQLDFRVRANDAASPGVSLAKIAKSAKPETILI